MKIKYNNATIRMNGQVNKEKIKEATIVFMSKYKGVKDNGNDNTSRTIKEKRVISPFRILYPTFFNLTYYISYNSSYYN